MQKTQVVSHTRKARKARTRVAKECGFSIRSKRDKFIVQVRRAGIREAKVFPTLDGAKLYCRQLATKLENEGLAAFDLTPIQRDDAKKAIGLLSGRASLVAAARAWLRLNPVGDALTVNQLFEQHLEDLRLMGRREKTILTRRQFLSRFGRDYGTRAASSITRDDVEQWLSSRVPPKSFNTIRGCLMAAFAFAVDRRIIESNPVEGIRPKRFDRSEPYFWTTDTVERVLRAAVARDEQIARQQSEMNRPPAQPWVPIAPYLALQAFGGLRPDEAARLDWSSISFEGKVIRLPAAASKVRRARLIPIENNLAAWLMIYRKCAGAVAPSPTTVKRARKAILEAAQLPAQWPQDVLRHSFASHWMALHAHEGRLAEIMGNSPSVIQKHYKGLVSVKEGERYFAIMPTPAGEIVPIEKAG